MSENKGLKLLSHGSIWIAPLLVPFIIYLVKKDEEVQKISLQAMFYHVMLMVMGIIVTLFATISFFAGTVTHADIMSLGIIGGFGFILFVGIFYILIPVKGIINTLNDKEFNYPIVRRFFN